MGQEGTFKANVLIILFYALACSVEHLGSTQTSVLFGKAKPENIFKELIDRAVTTDRLSGQVTGFVVGLISPSCWDYDTV